MSEMKQLIENFPKNISQALEIAEKTVFTKPQKEIHNVLICGMGGSGIGGRLVASWVKAEIKVPIQFNLDYDIPAFVNENTLVIGSSYSGNTEETLEALEKAVEKTAHIVCVCSGGKIKTFCEEKNLDAVIVPGGNPPRTALAFSVVQLLNLFSQLNLCSDAWKNQMISAQKSILSDTEKIHSEAKKLAQHLHNKVGVFYGTTNYEPVLVRARQQINENAKNLCWHHTIPEMNHNELVGWGGGDKRFATVFFDTKDHYKRNALRFEITQNVVEKKAGNYLIIEAKGNSVLERSVYLISIIDWASLYLSELNNVDPIDIEVIDYLKGTLSNFK